MHRSFEPNATTAHGIDQAPQASLLSFDVALGPVAGNFVDWRAIPPSPFPLLRSKWRLPHGNLRTFRLVVR